MVYGSYSLTVPYVPPPGSMAADGVDYYLFPQSAMLCILKNGLFRTEQANIFDAFLHGKNLTCFFDHPLGLFFCKLLLVVECAFAVHRKASNMFACSERKSPFSESDFDTCMISRFLHVFLSSHSCVFRNSLTVPVYARIENYSIITCTSTSKVLFFKCMHHA